MDNSNYKFESNLTLKELRDCIPDHLFKKSEFRFLLSVVISVGITLSIAYLAFLYIPLTVYFIPVWILYAFVCGTAAFGIWILGHECGHGAFSNNWFLNDALGYVLHTFVLVPYFSWQHSHHIHHQRTNHLTEGESHVPKPIQEKTGYQQLKNIMGDEAFSVFQLYYILLFGFPFYLIFGLTGGYASRGLSSHFFVPNKLFPMNKFFKVQLSTLGIFFVTYVCYYWAQQRSFAEVMAVYLGPYLVVNAYLTVITLLQHSQKEVPHYDSRSFNWLRGALCSIDRNYHPVIDFLQHHIGTTHVVHHLFPELPHYNAPVANVYLKQKLGNLYFYDKKSVTQALFESGKLVGVKDTGNGVWMYVD